MHWILQDNLYNEYGYKILVDTLERFSIKHSFVKITPFIDTLTPMPLIEPGELVYVCGALTMDRIAKSHKWLPGSFLNDNFDFNQWVEHYGSEVFNHDAIVTTFENVVPTAEKFFIRPIHDTKSVNQTIQERENFLEWQKKVVALGDDAVGLNYNTPVLYNDLKEIYQEYRFFVVNGEIVTQSLYKMGNKVLYDRNVDCDTIAYAKKLISTWQPSQAFVIDVVYGPSGYNMLEINNINSAGFYDCDVPKLVDAIESLTEDSIRNWKFNG